jgi:hypothetical protein
MTEILEKTILRWKSSSNELIISITVGTIAELKNNKGKVLDDSPVISCNDGLFKIFMSRTSDLDTIDGGQLNEIEDVTTFTYIRPLSASTRQSLDTVA